MFLAKCQSTCRNSAKFKRISSCRSKFCKKRGTLPESPIFFLNSSTRNPMKSRLSFEKMPWIARRSCLAQLLMQGWSQSYLQCSQQYERAEGTHCEGTNECGRALFPYVRNKCSQHCVRRLSARFLMAYRFSCLRCRFSVVLFQREFRHQLIT